MSPLPTFAVSGSGEEWNDAEFDFLDGEPIHTSDPDSDKEDEDWDAEMDLGKTGGAKAHAVLEDAAARCVAARTQSLTQGSGMVTIRPPISSSNADDDDESEGISTIKISALPKAPVSSPPPATVDEDFEDDLVIPTDMTELSLRPLSLLHRSSKSSMEWGDREHTTSSLSSDAFSTLGFTDNSAPSSCTSASMPETETEDEEEEDVLDGIVVPSGLFESGQGARKLVKILETKKKAAPAPLQLVASSPDPEDDFEAGLVLDDDMELSPSRLKLKANQTQSIMVLTGPRSKSVPPRTSVPNRPPSRLKSDKEKPNYPPVSSVQQFRKLPAPPPIPQSSSSTRSQTYSQVLTAGPAPTSSSSGSALSPKYGALRSQKSHTGLKPPSPPSTRRLTRKASLPALESSAAQASTSGPSSSSSSSYAAVATRYDAHTASSRAKIHTHSTSRISTLDFNVPPTRPSTPSSNPVALRLTMPTSSSRLKSRAPISSVFPQSGTATPVPPLPRSASPLPLAQQAGPSRAPSASSSRPRVSASQASPVVPAPKVLKRPKRPKTYGDGTELDNIEDLPLDREKEGRFRVQPKGYVTRVPGASFSQKDAISAGASGDRAVPRRVLKQDTGPAYPGTYHLIALVTISSLSFRRTRHFGQDSQTYESHGSQLFNTGTRTEHEEKEESGPWPGSHPAQAYLDSQSWWLRRPQR